MPDSSTPELYYLDYQSEFLSKVRVLAQKVSDGDWQPDFVVGVGRGGLVPAVYISHQLDIPMLSIDHSAKVPGFADELLNKLAGMSAEGSSLLFVDDINDSGGTIAYLRKLLRDRGCADAHVRFAVLINNTRSKANTDFWVDEIDREQDKRWFVFPWESVGTENTIIDEALFVPDRLA